MVLRGISRVAKAINKVLAWPFVLLIEIYRIFISPLLPPSCRFYPTCSVYTRDALKKHGLVRGLYLGTRRISRCHPGNPGGYDPVP